MLLEGFRWLIFEYLPITFDTFNSQPASIFRDFVVNITKDTITLPCSMFTVGFNLSIALVCLSVRLQSVKSIAIMGKWLHFCCSQIFCRSVNGMCLTSPQSSIPYVLQVYVSLLLAIIWAHISSLSVKYRPILFSLCCCNVSSPTCWLLVTSVLE